MRDSRESTPADGWVVLVAALLARALPLWLSVEHYGDAPVRIEAAERWLAAPHLWHGFLEAFQYGPLHLTLLAGAVAVAGRFAGPKLLSLAFGLAGVWLLHKLARRVAGPRAARFAALALALSPMHIQASTTGASEAIFLALLLAAIELFLAARETLSRKALLGSALLLGLASLVRYDGLLYVGLLSAVLLADAPAAKVRAAATAFLYGALACVLPALWLLQCRRFGGDALAPLHHINQDHLGLAAGAIHYLGELRYRLYCLFYWPAAVLAVCTPLTGALAMVGAARTLALLRLRRLTGAEVVALLAWLPAAYFTFRGAVLVDFRPLSRFALVAGALSLPFAWDAMQFLGARLHPAARKGLVALTALSLIGAPVALAAASYGRQTSLAEWARPLSPISTLPPGIAEAARWVRANTRPGELVLLDHTWHFLDIGLAFESGLPESQLARRAWPDFEEKLREQRPSLAVLIIDGELRLTSGAEGASYGAPRFTFRGLQFCAAAHYTYASVYRRCSF